MTWTKLYTLSFSPPPVGVWFSPPPPNSEQSLGYK